MGREMGNECARSSGLEQAPDKFADTIRKLPHSSVYINCCIGGIIMGIEEENKETTSGRMVNW
jgi:hypothetical protein